MVTLASVTGIRPELWADRTAAAVACYEAAFGARVLHRVGAGHEREIGRPLGPWPPA